MTTHNEIYRKFAERALEAGRHWQSPHSQFVQYTPLDPSCREVAPLYENALFILALLKSRTAENIGEAKVLLERLLFHQARAPSLSAGNFPRYLHESPTCHSRWMGIKLLAPLYQSYQLFHTVLGEDLRQKSAEALLTLCGYALQTLEKESAADYGIALQIGAGVCAVGRLFDRSDLVSDGEQILNDLEKLGLQPHWLSREGLGEMVIHLQMAYGKISESPWKFFWQHLKSTWHPVWKIYRGPAFEEFQEELSPKATLYDRLMASFNGEMPCHSSLISICDLHGILIVDTQDRMEVPVDVVYEAKVGDAAWKIYSSAQCAWSVIEQPGADSQSQKGCHPFLLQWKAEGSLYSLAVAGGRFSAMQHRVTEKGVDLIFELSAPVENDHPLENREISFFCTAYDGLKIDVEGVAATTFRLGERVEIAAGGKIGLRIVLDHGEGDFLGHLMPGNRPAQLAVKKNQPGKAFDRQIFVRTLRKSGPCTLRVSIELDC